MNPRFGKSREYLPGERAGEAFGRELLGIVKNVETIEEERQKVYERMARDNLFELEAAMEEIRGRQMSSPTNPRQAFANKIRTKVFDILEDVVDDTKLKFYTAVSGSENKTVLDRDFGIDAFFELEQRKDRPLIVTVDLTLKPYKENPRAGITFSIPTDFPLTARFDKGKIEGLSESE